MRVRRSKSKAASRGHKRLAIAGKQDRMKQACAAGTTWSEDADRLLLSIQGKAIGRDRWPASTWTNFLSPSNSGKSSCGALRSMRRACSKTGKGMTVLNIRISCSSASVSGGNVSPIAKALPSLRRSKVRSPAAETCTYLSSPDTQTHCSFPGSYTTCGASPVLCAKLHRYFRRVEAALIPSKLPNTTLNTRLCFS